MTEPKSSTGMPEQPIIQPTQFDPEDEYRPEPEPEPLPPSWMDGSLRIGIHTSIAGSYLNALESARKLGCNALQIFSASPRMGQGGAAPVPEVGAAAVLTPGGAPSRGAPLLSPYLLLPLSLLPTLLPHPPR